MSSSSDGVNLVAASDSFIYTSTDSGVSWVERFGVTGQNQWRSIASSANGMKLAAVSADGRVHVSVDGGATWQESQCDCEASTVSSSADGNTLVATDFASAIHISTDSGANWYESTSIQSYLQNGGMVSPDGSVIVATGSGSIYSSNDLGQTWSQVFVGAYGAPYIALNEDGSKIIAAIDGDSIYHSTDIGSSWKKFTVVGAQPWSQISSSDNGLRIAAISANSIYTSADSGTTWVERTSAGSRQWTAIASNADGTKLVATESHYDENLEVTAGSIYTSADSGATWVEQTGAGSREWTDIASSAAGTKLYGAAYGNFVYSGILSDALPIDTPSETIALSSITAPTGTDDGISTGTLSIASEACDAFVAGSTRLYAPSEVETSDSDVKVLGGVGFSIACTTTGGSTPLTLTLGKSYGDPSLLRAFKSNQSTQTLEDISNQG